MCTKNGTSYSLRALPQESIGRYYENDEKELINQIEKYKEKYFLQVKDISVPPTNTLSERSLRMQKTKLHVQVSIVQLIMPNISQISEHT